jgi:hypothetical protein
MASPDLAAVTEAKHVLIARACRVDTVFVRNPSATVAADLLIYDANDIADVTLGTTEHVRRFGLSPGFCGTILLGIAFDSGVCLAARTAGTTSTAPDEDLDVTLGLPQ